MLSQRQPFQLFYGISIYFISGLGAVALIKFLNYYYNFHSWLVFALLSRSTWTFSLVLHLFLQYPQYFRCWWFSDNDYILGKKRNPQVLRFSKAQMKIYFAVGLGMAIVELFNSFSLNILPGSLYMMLKGSDVGWSMLLSFLILKKRYTRMQVLAAVLILTGICLVFVLDKAFPKNEEQLEHKGPLIDKDLTVVAGSVGADIVDPSSLPLQSSQLSPESAVPIWVASLVCLAGAFLHALCTVAIEGALKDTLAKEQGRLLLEHQEQQKQHQQLLQNEQEEGKSKTMTSAPLAFDPPSKLLLSNAYSMWTTFFTFLVLVVPVSLFGSSSEAGKIFPSKSLYPYDQTMMGGINSTNPIEGDLAEQDLSEGGTLSSSSSGFMAAGSSIDTATIVIVCCLALLGVARFSERLSKYWICVSDSAMTFSIVQAARRMSGVYIIGWIFQEPFSLGFWVGSICSSSGFILHYYSKNSAATCPCACAARRNNLRNKGEEETVEIMADVQTSQKYGTYDDTVSK